MSEKEERLRNRQKALKALSMIFQLALSAVCPILILIFAGIYLDGRFGGGHRWYTLAGALLGIYAAYRSTWLLLRDNFLREKETAEQGKESEKT